MTRKPITRDGSVAWVKDPNNWAVDYESSNHTVRMLMMNWKDRFWVRFQRRSYKNYYLCNTPMHEPVIGWADIGIYEWDPKTESTVCSVSMTELANHIYMTDRAQ